MKTIELTFPKRLSIISVIGRQNGNVAQVREWSKLLDRLMFTPEEAAEVGFELKEEDGSFRFNEKKLKEKNPLYTLQLEDSEAASLSSCLERSDVFNPIHDRWILSFVDSLK